MHCTWGTKRKLCNPMETYGNLCNPMETHGNLWEPMEIYETPWKPMEGPTGSKVTGGESWRRPMVAQRYPSHRQWPSPSPFKSLSKLSFSPYFSLSKTNSFLSRHFHNLSQVQSLAQYQLEYHTVSLLSLKSSCTATIS